MPRQDDSDLPRLSGSAVTEFLFTSLPRRRVLLSEHPNQGRHARTLLGPNPSVVVRHVLTLPSYAIKAHDHPTEALG